MHGQSGPTGIMLFLASPGPTRLQGPLGCGAWRRRPCVPVQRLLDLLIILTAAECEPEALCQASTQAPAGAAHMARAAWGGRLASAGPGSPPQLLCVKPVATLYALCLLFIQINILKTSHARGFQCEAFTFTAPQMVC